ncbi:hypothetical protein OSTOST_13514, partial [Ostertagia ostertagi]
MNLLPDNAQLTPAFLVLCFVNIFGKGVSTIAIPSMLMERLVASYYISDYEAKSRIWVAASVAATSCALPALYSWGMIFGTNIVTQLSLVRSSKAVLTIAGMQCCFSFDSVIVRVLGVDKVVIFIVGLCIASSVVYVRLYQREQRRLENFIIGSQTRQYLSTRFQLIENLRVLKTIMFASLIYSVWILVPGMLIMMVFFYFLPFTYVGQLLFEFFELFIS